MKPKILRLLFFLLFSNLFISCTDESSSAENEIADSPSIVINFEYNSAEIETMTLINNYRESLGLKKLEKINHISHKSEEHDHYMIANNVVNHDEFEARSTNLIKVLKAKTVSENIAYNFNSPQGAFDAWLKSDTHKKNIEGDYTHFGIAIRENPANGKKYYTNIFVKI